MIDNFQTFINDEVFQTIWRPTKRSFIHNDRCRTISNTLSTLTTSLIVTSYTSN